MSSHSDRQQEKDKQDNNNRSSVIKEVAEGTGY